MNKSDALSFIANCFDDDWDELNLSIIERRKTLNGDRVTNIKKKKALEYLSKNIKEDVARGMIREKVFKELEEDGYIIIKDGMVCIV